MGCSAMEGNCMAYADVELKKVRNNTVLGFKFSILPDKNTTDSHDRYVGLILAKNPVRNKVDLKDTGSIMIICHHNKVSTEIVL